MERSIRELADLQTIRDVLARYWRGIDRCDAELVRSTYHPDAYDDHGYYKGPLDGFIESLPLVWNTFAGTQHHSGHIAVELVGSDAARAESYAEAHHILRREDGSADDLVYGLRYVDRFERRLGEWRIAHRVCTWDWHRIDPGIGLPLGDGYYRGCRDRSDLVYEHPAGAGRPVGPDELVAKQACFDALMRYARGVDRCDQELVRSAYHPGAYDDHGGYQGDVDGFVSWVKGAVMDVSSATMHNMGNSLIEVDGDRAFGETYAVAHHVLVDGSTSRDLVMGVRYIDRFECRDGEWKIAHRVMSYEWERSASLPSQDFGERFLRGLRDGSDPVLGSPSGGASESVETAADRAAIYAQLVRYCRAVDRCDETLLRSVYQPDAHDDHGAYRGGVDGFVAWVRCEVQERFRCTMHKLGNSFIEIDGDVARCETYAVAHHVRAEDGRDVDDLVIGVRYLDRFERRAGAWRIARRELRFEWQRKDALRPLDPEWTLGCRGSGDPVYSGAPAA